MKKIRIIAAAVAVFAIVLGAFGWWISRGNPAEFSLAETSGVDPVLAEPHAEWFPTVAIAEPVGWGENGKPDAADSVVVNRFADGLDHPRVIYTMPNGDVLVTLTRAPDANISDNWLTNTIAGFLFDKAGASGPSPNQLVLLRDGDGDGIAEERFILRDDLDSPSGIAWREGNLYIANHDAVLRFAYEEGATTVSGAPEKIMDLPPAGNHWMRNIFLHPAEDTLFIAVGSASNIGENGMAIEQGRAAIHELDLATGVWRLFGAGLRNPNGMDWHPWAGELWTTVNERDMLGSDLVPDYMSNVPIGVHYGWPWLYFNDVVDERVEARMPDFLQEYTRTPEYALGAHTAPLGMVFTAQGVKMPFGPGAYVARHGSWNRKPAAGYDVVFVAFDERGNPTGKPEPVLKSFLTDDGKTFGRPTWLAWDQTGALLISDDTAGIIWRAIAPDAPPAAQIAPLPSERLPPLRELTGDPARAFEQPPADIGLPGAP